MKNILRWLAGVMTLLALVVIFFIGQSTPVVKQKTVTLTVVAQEGTFTIVAPDAVQVKAGENGGFTVDVQPELGFSKPVKFTVQGGPPGMQVTWQNNDDTWNPGQTPSLVCVLIVPLDNALVGSYPLTLTGTSQ